MAARGNRSWSYAEVLPYFRRAKDDDGGGDRYHGVGGPQRVEHLQFVHPISDALVAGFAALGVRRNDDFDGPQQDGVGRMRVTHRDGAWWSAADATCASPRAGQLDLRPRAQAARILVEDARATGMAYVQDGQERQVLAGEGW